MTIRTICIILYVHTLLFTGGVMEAKLTLKLSNDSISRAKEYVSQIGTSLSAIVENFFDNLTVNDNKSEFSYSPLVNELSGIIHLDENFDYKSDYTSYLDKKYE